MGWGFRTQKAYLKCLYIVNEYSGYHSNNYKKLHGKPMKRWCWLTKEAAKMRNKMQ